MHGVSYEFGCLIQCPFSSIKAQMPISINRDVTFKLFEK